MKIYIGNVDWAGEGDVFFYSVISEEKFDLLYKLFNILLDLHLLPEADDFYWGTNEFFEFGIDDIKEFFEDAEYIEDYELEVFNKFGVDGYDIYSILIEYLYDIINIYDYDTNQYIFNEDLTEENIETIKPLFIGLFSEEDWYRIKKYE